MIEHITEPLLNTTVLDLSNNLAGAYMAALLADANATVFRPEDLEVEIDDAGTGGDAGARATLGAALLRGRRPVSRSDVPALLRQVDLVIDTGAFPNAIFEKARQGRTELTVISLTDYGLTGPSSGRGTTSAVLQAECGSAYWRGLREQEPLMVGGDVEHYLAGAYGAAAALAGLRGARKHGVGTHYDLSILEAANLGFTTFGLTRASIWGEVGRDYPHRSIQVPAIERTLDGWVGLCTISSSQRQDLMLLIDRPDLAEDEAIAYAGTDSADTADVRAAVDAWTRQQTTDEIIELASAFRIPVSPIGHGANLVENEQLVARGFYDVSSDAVTTKPCFRFTPHQRARVDRRSPDRLHENAAEIDPTMSLTGIRVVDMTAWWAGPAATHLYAALGADVVKIESARRPDGMRYSFVPDPAAQDWWEHGPVYYALNTNKRGMSLDFTHPQGRELLTDLITNADLLIENFTPRVLDSLDLDWDLIDELNPGLVTVRMPAFGLEGPWRDRTGFAQTIEQSSGLAWTTGHANGSPVAPRGVCDPLAGIHAAFAGLAALERRDREDQGGMMEVPMLDVAATATLGQVLAWRSTGAAPQRVGNRSPRLAPQGTYRAAGVDDWVTLSVRDDDDWIALADLLEQPQWRHAPWLDPTYRAQNGGEIDAGIANWMGSRPGSVGAEALRSVGIPAARADGSGRLLQHPQLQHREFFETVDHPVAGRHPVPGLPFRPVDRRVLWNRCAAPILGQHTAEVLRDWLGLDDTAINDIMAAGITGTDPTATEER